MRRMLQDSPVQVRVAWLRAQRHRLLVAEQMLSPQRIWGIPKAIRLPPLVSELPPRILESHPSPEYSLDRRPMKRARLSGSPKNNATAEKP